MKHLNRALFSSLGLGLLGLACSSTDTPGGGTGGVLGTGSVAATGAVSGTGGSTVGTGAVGATGGGTGALPGTGGTPGTGAVPGTGGVVGTGSVAATGGITGDGGAPPTGGAAGSGTGGGGGTPVREPTLVTSTKVDDFNMSWTEGEVTEGGSAPTVTVNDSMMLQKFYGFGGSFNEKGWEALMKLATDAERLEAMKLLFDKVDGANFTWGRIPIGASDYATKRYTLNDTAGDLAMASFTLEQDQKFMIPFVKEAQKVRADIKFWGSPWTPPPWMKDNNSYDKGSMKNTKENLDAYALYFVKFIQGYEAEGIHIHSVHPQNEPGWSQSYPTAAWGPSKDTVTDATITGTPFLGKFVAQNLAPALSAAGLTTEIWYGTFSNGDYSDDYWNDLKSANGIPLVKGVGLQWSGKNIIPNVQADGPNLIIMQSEHQCGNYPWLGNNGTATMPATSSAASKAAANDTTFWAPEAPNNYNYALESWKLIKEWIGRGVHTYSAWNMVLDQKGFSLDTVRPWPQNALLFVGDDNKLHTTPTYWVFRHMSQYVDYGAVLVGTSSDDALAFKNPDGSIVTIMFNSGGTDAATTLSAGGKMYQFTVPAGGWATVNVGG